MKGVMRKCLALIQGNFHHREEIIPIKAWELPQLLLLFLEQTNTFSGTGEVYAFAILVQVTGVKNL